MIQCIRQCRSTIINEICNATKTPTLYARYRVYAHGAYESSTCAYSTIQHYFRPPKKKSSPIFPLHIFLLNFDFQFEWVIERARVRNKEQTNGFRLNVFLVLRAEIIIWKRLLIQALFSILTLLHMNCIPVNECISSENEERSKPNSRGDAMVSNRILRSDDSFVRFFLRVVVVAASVAAAAPVRTHS